MQTLPSGKEPGPVTDDKNAVDKLSLQHLVHPASVGFIIVDESHEYRTLGTRKRTAFALLLATIRRRQKQQVEAMVSCTCCICASM